LSSITAILSRDTRDYKLDPSSGYLSSASVEYAGIGGSEHFVKYIASHRHFFPFKWDTVFSINGEIGYIQEVNNELHAVVLHGINGLGLKIIRKRNCEVVKLNVAEHLSCVGLNAADSLQNAAEVEVHELVLHNHQIVYGKVKLGILNVSLNGSANGSVAFAIGTERYGNLAVTFLAEIEVSRKCYGAFVNFADILQHLIDIFIGGFLLFFVLLVLVSACNEACHNHGKHEKKCSNFLLHFNHPFLRFRRSHRDGPSEAM
ncbi:MAG: BamA/TamA family outer membrane protein, partial [Lachnospiraceae bacterium]|nr:BamA/TamA family outer membrane protein [Lachnospiraceae bacterium]